MASVIGKEEPTYKRLTRPWRFVCRLHLRQPSSGAAEDRPEESDSGSSPACWHVCTLGNYIIWFKIKTLFVKLNLLDNLQTVWSDRRTPALKGRVHCTICVAVYIITGTAYTENIRLEPCIIMINTISNDALPVPCIQNHLPFSLKVWITN